VKRTRKTDWIEVVVDGVEFISVFRVLRKMFPGGIPDARLTVDNGIIDFEFSKGGARIPCKSRHVIVAHIPGATIRRIATVYGVRNRPSGDMTLVFRPKLQVFATPCAGGPANIASIVNTPSVPSAQID